MPVVRLTWEDGPERFRQMAALHAAAIHHGALPLLGQRFMARMYRELARAPGCGAWAVLRNDRLGGFVIGCADLRASLRRVFLHAGLPLLLLALPRLFSWTLLRKLPSLFLYAFRQPAESADVAAPLSSDRAELLAIAVDPSCRGQGVGRILVQHLEDFLWEQGRVASYRVTTNAADPVSNSFYRGLGFEPAGICPHHDLYLQCYSKRFPSRRAS